VSAAAARLVRRALVALALVAALAVLAWAFGEIFLRPGASQLNRIRAAVSAGAILLLAATFESIRRTQLKERYALLWVLPSLVILLLAFFPRALDRIRLWFGMEYGSIMAGVAFLSLMMAVFVISRTLSKNENNITRIAQRAALLEQRVRELEDRLARRKDSDREPPRA